MWHVACNLGNPLFLELLFGLPLSNAAFRDTKASCFSHFTVLLLKIMICHTLCFLLFCSRLALFNPNIYSTATNLLRISCWQNLVLFFTYADLLCSSDRLFECYLGNSIWISLGSLHSLTVYSQIYFAALQHSDYLLNSKRDLSCVNNSNIHFHYCNLKLDCLPRLSALRQTLQNDLVFLQTCRVPYTQIMMFNTLSWF